MNNRGFGILQMLLFGIFVFFVIYIFASFIGSFSNIFESKNSYKFTKNVYSNYVEKTAIDVKESYQTYEEIEKDVADAMLTYIKNNDIKLEENKKINKSLNYFIENNYIKNIKDITNNAVYCEGYATAEFINNNENKYIGFIKCGNNFESDGFEKNYIKD